MADPSSRIPIPWALRLHRLRRRLLPAVCFVGCAALTFAMWRHQGTQPNARGEVEVVRVDVAARSVGTLLTLPRGAWNLFDTVEPNQILATFDDRPVRAELATLEAELKRLNGEFAAESARLTWEQADREHDQQREAARLAWAVERLRLNLLDRRVRIESDRIEEQRLAARLDYLNKLSDQQVAVEADVVESRLRRDVTSKRIEENVKAIAEVESQIETAIARQNELPPADSPELGTILAPLRQAALVQETRIAAIGLAIESLAIRSPIAGTISTIHRRPGQTVQPGDPIVTVAADRGRFIISYVRQEQRLKPEVGMPVTLWVGTPMGAAHRSSVQRIGPQIEPIPLHLLRDPTKPEWGLPVQIALSGKWDLRPGELVDVRFMSP